MTTAAGHSSAVETLQLQFAAFMGAALSTARDSRL